MAAMFPTERSGVPMFGMDTAVDKAAARRQPATAAPEGAAAAVLADPMYKQFVGEPRAKLEKAQQEYGRFEGEMTADQAAREARKLGRRQEAFGAYEQAVRAPELRAERTALEERAGEAFVPTQENVQDMATIFSLIGVLGFAIGAGGKNNAIQAMNAMNGMMEGYKQGREDRYLREKDLFESNANAIKTKIDALNNRMKDIAQLAAVDMEKANMEADMLFAQEGADFLKQYKDKVGLVNTIKMLQDQVKGGQELFKFIQTEKLRADEKERERQLRIALQQRRENIQIVLANQKAALRGKGGYQSALLAGRAENIREAFAQAAKDIVNITKMPPNTMLGTFAGLTGASADGMVSGIRNAVARGVTDKEQRMLETLIAGIEGHMAFALGGGYATSQSKARMDQYKAQLARAGDDPIQVPLMLARFKQEMNILAENFGSKPGATEEMDNAVQKYNDNINAAIPFTVEDVLNSQFAPAVPKSKDSGGWTVREKK